MERLVRYFTEGIENRPIANTIGVEVETSFMMEHENGSPITVAQSQLLIERFRRVKDWRITKTKGNLIAEISDGANKLSYELGRQNLELSIAPDTNSAVAVSRAMKLADELGSVASYVSDPDARFLWEVSEPIIHTNEDLLMIPDERDATWLELDGRPALELLARTSAVQFTISVSLKDAIECLNRLGEKIGSFLKDYPQEENWRRYIKESKADYHAMRYGGPLFFDSIEDYCKKLIKHNVVVGPELVPYNQVRDLDIPLYLRSIWWYFRLRRYENTLCIEVRPLPRRDSRKFKEQFDFVMNIMQS
ncbi:MAG: hypothetical protein HYT62_01800 [Candidatus Yanofskybacteria bacterium]|nr:hypothetical protein [Candidatus Yanofskybacteria bacterium]